MVATLNLSGGQKNSVLSIAKGSFLTNPTSFMIFGLKLYPLLPLDTRVKELRPDGPGKKLMQEPLLRIVI